MKTKLTEYGTKIPEDENEKLWKYLDIWKFIDLLSTSKLHFTRADIIQKNEPFDGKYPDKLYEILKNAFLELNKGDDKLASMDTFFHQQFDKILSKLFFINCWNTSPHESTALWKIYTQNNQGIAIQTTYKKLMDSIRKKSIYPGLVNYIDHRTLKFDNGNSLNYQGNAFYHSFLKHISYNYEKEFRLVYYELNKRYIKSGTKKIKSGVKIGYAYDTREWIKIPINNLSNLVENIYASPFMESWQIEILDILLNKFKINKKIKHSELHYKESSRL